MLSHSNNGQKREHIYFWTQKMIQYMAELMNMKYVHILYIINVWCYCFEFPFFFFWIKKNQNKTLFKKMYLRSVLRLRSAINQQQCSLVLHVLQPDICWNEICL